MLKHATFTIKREFNAPVEKVFTAFSDFEKKKMWFAGPEGEDEQTMDFRIGGIETSSGKIHGTVHSFTALYYDIVENERIIYTYEMYLNGVRISVSLASIELESMKNKTKLTLTESGAFLDGMDNPDQRRVGTEELLTQLQKFVEKDYAK